MTYKATITLNYGIPTRHGLIHNITVPHKPDLRCKVPRCRKVRGETPYCEGHFMRLVRMLEDLAYCSGIPFEEIVSDGVSKEEVEE